MRHNVVLGHLNEFALALVDRALERGRLEVDSEE